MTGIEIGFPEDEIIINLKTKKFKVIEILE